MIRKFALAAAGLAIAVTAVLAGSHAGQFDRAVTTRQSHMRLNLHNIGILSAMAKGDMDYDAEVAVGAAANLVALSRLSKAGYWPAGSDSEATEGTAALPVIWDNLDDLDAKFAGLADAASAMESAAAIGLAELQGAIGGGRRCLRGLPQRLSRITAIPGALSAIASAIISTV